MSSTTDFACVFCKETFENKEILQEHFRKHADPNFNSGSKTKIRPQNEQATGEKAEEVETVGCDVCDETFPSISKAITHKHKVHPDHDAKHFCPWCGKLFTMKHLYNKHMQSMHSGMAKTDDEVIYHCDCCEVDFYVPSAMVYHNKFFHRQDTELPAIGHSKKVKTVNQELLHIYYCPFCGEEYNNKVNLHKHMGNDHSDENQSPDEVLRCPLCEAVFYHLDAYELHLSFHSTEDVYNDENETTLDVTDFSLESVPPIMEKVEEETKNPEPTGIDTFLQLVMDDSRESGNTDNNDRPKSKKHKKHKKSKKAAITLDEFLNMNKDVFGDGLDVQGIEEVPTQQVLKKIKGKNVKPVPASAIAKLKKQGITIKSKVQPYIKPVLKTNINLSVNTAKVLPNNVPYKVQEKPSTTVTSNELLSKLLNQGNSQIKIVKRSVEENSVKEKNIHQPDQEKLIIKSPTQNKLLPNTSDTEEENGNKAEEISQVADDIDSEMAQNTGDMQSEDKINNKGENNSDEHNKCTENNNSSHYSNNTQVNKESNNHIIANKNKVEAETLDDSEMKIKSSDACQKVTQNATDIHIHMSDKDDSFETSKEMRVNTSDELIPEDTEVETDPELIYGYPQENSNNVHKPLDALKHLSGLITVKPAQNPENKNDDTELSRSENNSEEETDYTSTNNFKIKNIQNVALNKTIGQIKGIPQTKSVDSLKNLSSQLTIKHHPAGNSSKVDEENKNCESDDDSHEDISGSNTINEDDNAPFKTPIFTTKQTIVKKPIQMKTPIKEMFKEEDNIKNSFNMDILKRLTNVTAKPVAKPANNIPPPKPVVQNVNTSGSFIQKVEKNKVIDQDVEIFNIDDSDDDQEVPNEDTVPKKADLPKSTENKVSASADILKNLSKNITIKPPTPSSNKNLNIKKDIHGKKVNMDRNVHSPKGNNVNFQKKQVNMNLNHTLKKLGSNISIKSQYSSPDSQGYQMQHDDDDDMDDQFDMNDEESDTESSSKVKISEVQDDEDVPSDIDTEYNENVIVQSPHGTNSENEEDHQNNHSDNESNDDIEKQIKINTLSKEKTATNECLDNFKRNNRQLTIKSLNEKNTDFPQVGSPSNKKEEGQRPTKHTSKDMSNKNENEVVTKKVTQSAASSSATQKVTNQVNTVKTVKTFQSETIIEEITTTVTKTIRTVNQSSKQVAQNANVNTYRPRLMIPNQQVRPMQGMTVRNAQTVGTKIRNAAPPRPTIAMPSRPQGGQLVPVRPQNQIVARQGVFRASAPGPSNIRKISPQVNVQKPVPGKPLKISPLAMNQTIKRPSEDMPGHFSCFKKPKDSMMSSMDTFDDDFDDDSTVNYSTAASSRSDFSTTATKIVKGKAVVTATQARSEQHSEQHITKLNNVSGLKIVRSSAKQASQVETRTDNVGAANRTTLDAIEKLQKQGLLIKKPRIEAPEETEQYHSESDEDFDEK